MAWRLSHTGNSPRRFSTVGNAKRASMREGPLAALFRKTEGTEEQAADEPRDPSVAGPPSAGAGAHEPARSHPSLSAREQGAPQAPVGGMDTSALATPSAPARVPTPRERLRHAFSSEIPHSMMDPSTPAAAGMREAYAHAHVEPSARQNGSPVIRVVGVGGAGVNAVNRMVEAEVEGVQFIAVNTDLQSLQSSTAHITLHIGDGVTRGLGAGASPDLGRQAAMEEYDKIKALLK